MRMNVKGLGGPLVKSFLFVVVTVTATAVLAISIANTGVGNADRYKARFSDVTGLIEGDSIRIAGVRVGQVTEIKVVNRRQAQVEFSVQRGRRLPSSTKATIKYLNLVGQRYIELDRGTGAPGATMARGSTIPLERTTPALNLTQLFNGFQPLFQALSPADVNQLAGEIIQVLQGEGPTMDSLLRTVASLTSTLAGKDQVIGQVIDNLNEVLETINARGDQLADLIVTLRRLTSGLAADRKPLGEAIGAMSALTNSTADLLQVGRAPLKDSIGQLGRLSDELADESPEIERFLRTVPGKSATIARLASYGSWLNLYMCQATVTGATYTDGRPPPTGVPMEADDATRCGGQG
ncbi:MCE family protein [Actinomadura sp. 21ATH]|uniref:MCE family protein n=1 Tax=Actinomadura sp. 21ATH TaxID=1735444 RepID=UPI0035BFD47F